MKEELLKLEDVENMGEEELQSLDSMELEEQIKSQEPTIIVTNQDADFYVKEELEELQLLEGTRNELQLLESTELAHSFEDPCFYAVFCLLNLCTKISFFTKLQKLPS